MDADDIQKASDEDSSSRERNGENYKNRGDEIFLLTDSIRHRTSLERLSGHLLSFSRICLFGISK